MNSQRSASYNSLLIFYIAVCCILIGCAPKINIKTSPPSPIDNVIEEKIIKTEKSANTLNDISLSTIANTHTLTLSAANTLTYTVFKLSKPDRILIDLQELAVSPSLIDEDLRNELINNISCSAKEYNNEKFLRLEIALNQDVTYNASSSGNSLKIEIIPKAENLTPKNNADKPSAVNDKTIYINGISVSKTESDKISILSTADLKKYSTYTLKNPNRIVVDLPGIKSSLKNEQVENNGKIVDKIRIGASSNNLRIVVDLKGDKFPLYQVAQKQKILNIIFDDNGKKSVNKNEKNQVINERSATEEIAKKTDIEENTDDTKTKQYTGEKISLDFKDADIKNILRLIADISGKNIIISDNAKGKITLKLENIPWDEALDIILETNNLGKIITNTVTRIETREQIKKINEEKLLARKSEENIADLLVKSYDISYAKAADLSVFIKNMNVLSERGSVNSFVLTNKLTVQDIEENFNKIEKLISEQDIPTRQVLIEAKIVQSNPGYIKELGVKWGGTYQTSRNGGPINLAGAAAGNVVNLAGASNAAIQFGYIMDNYSLDLQLTALENDDKIKILSSPKILGLDNKEARIKQGVALPYLKLSEEGVTSTEFKDMVLELKVTPKITPANTIAVHIFVTKNQPSAQTGTGGEPGIDVREVETDLLIESAKTIVIGGIYETTNTRIIHKVPFFGDLPLIKRFFRYEKTEDQLQEMLVFLTVTVVNQPSLIEG